MGITAPFLLPFVVSVGVVIAMIVLQFLLLLFTGIGFNFDHEHDVDHDLTASHDTGHGHGFSFARFLNPIGFGQVPLSIIWYAYGLSFGLSGIILSYGLTHFFVPTLWFFIVTIPGALIVGWHATKRAVRLVAPLVRTDGRAEDQFDLVGRIGKITSIQADAKYGEISIRLNDSFNHMIVKTQGETLERGEEVIVIGFDDEIKRPIIAKVLV